MGDVELATAGPSRTDHPDPDGSTPAPPRAGWPSEPLRDRAEFALIALVTVAAGVAGWLHRWTADDAFINFRVVDNLLAGDGPVYNAGERVEVATSTLWLALLSAAEALVPGDAVAWSSVALGLACTMLGLAAAATAARRLFRSASRWLTVPFGAAALAALPPFWDFTTSGLETGLSFGWLGASFLAAVRVAGTPPTGRGRGLPCAVLLGLGPLVRPDLGVVSALLLLWLVFAVAGSRSARCTRLLVAVALPVAVEIFRMGYYGLLVPNTAVAKESGRAVWGRGWDYLLDLVQPHQLWVPLLLAVAVLAAVLPRVSWRRPEMLLVVAVEVAALAHAAYVVRVGGDFMHGRFLLPSLFLLLCPVMVVPVPSSARRGLPVVAVVAALAAWCCLSALVLRPAYTGGVSAAGIADERGFWTAQAGTADPVTLEDHGRNGVLPYSEAVSRLQRQGADVIVAQVATVAPETPVVVLGPSAGGVVFAVGNAGFYGVAPGLGVFVVDGLGLTDPVGSHLEAPPPGRAGHEKVTPVSWLFARYGAPQLAEEGLPGVATAVDVTAARAAVGCGPVAELVAATNDPLTWHRFWDNLTGAVSRTSLRIPSDPGQARDRFC